MALIALAMLAVLLVAEGDAAHADSKIVTPRGTFSTIAEALVDAQPGETLEVRGGIHGGPLKIDQSVQIEGTNWPVIEGAGEGTVVTVLVPGVTITGFEIRGSGTQLVNEDSAIEVNAPNAVISGNRIRDALFGVYLREAHDSVIRDNEITGMDLEPARRGDAIRVWSSHRTTIEGNRVRKARDVVLWYSEDLSVRGNEVVNGRYGLHFMYCDDALVTGNRLVGNSVGAFLMYSRRLALNNNVIAENRGPSGYGVGLKDIDDAVIERNLFADNRVGAYIDNSPRESASKVEFISNTFVLNDFGLRLMPSVRNNNYTGNAFIDNGEQVEAAGGGNLGANRWAVDGRGNYWSDYAGYDADGDGYGDMAYEAARLFERLADENPAARMISYGPAAQAIDLGARIAPFTRPEPKLTDPSPAMSPGDGLGLKVHSEWSPVPAILSSSGLVGLALIIGAMATRSPGPGSRVGGVGVESANTVTRPNPILAMQDVCKNYGSNQVLTGVSFRVQRGEGVAIWGANGAGKTTAIRCLLGVTGFAGQATVEGHDVRRDGKASRRRIGFVPQEMGFSGDTSIEDTVAFFAGLRQVPAHQCDRLIARLGLEHHRRKRVNELSGGLRQRLAIALALLGDPPVLVMDEPTANLDAAGRDDVLKVLTDLRKEGKTLVIASHRPDEIAVLADRVLVMRDGRITEDLTPSVFINRNVRAVTLRLTLESELADGAVRLLTDQGFPASRSANNVMVQVNPMSKAAPVAALSKAGIEVVDFELSGSRECGDD